MIFFEDSAAISAMTMPTVTLAPPMVYPMGPMGAMPMSPVPVAFQQFQPTMLVPVAMVMMPSPCSTPTSVPSFASSEMVSQGSFSRQSTADAADATETTSTGTEDAVEPVSVAGCVWDLSQRHKGCRLVQQALEHCGEADRAMLAQELKGHIVEASRSPCGNYVLQKLIQVLRPQSCQFIIHELMEDPEEVCDLARHQYGCRILQRLFENCQAEQMEQIVHVLLKEASTLVCHSYGTYVMQQIFDFGTETQRRKLCDVLLAARSNHLCNDEHATQVLQKALQHAPQQVQLAESLVQQLPQMAKGRHSHQTVITAMQLLPEKESERAIGLLSQKINKLWASRYGRLVVKSIPKLYQQCSSMTRREAASA